MFLVVPSGRRCEQTTAAAGGGHWGEEEGVGGSGARLQGGSSGCGGESECGGTVVPSSREILEKTRPGSFT